MRVLCKSSIGVCLVLLFVARAAAGPPGYQFTRIVGPGDAIPGGGAFERVELRAATDDYFLFVGRDTGGSWGTFRYHNGTIETVIAASDPVPGGGGATFSGSLNTNAAGLAHDGTVSFRAGTSDPSLVGLYTESPSGFDVVADTNTPAPFTVATSPVAYSLPFSAFDGPDVAYPADDASGTGLAIAKVVNGTPSLVVGQSTPVPGLSPSKNFEDFASISIHGGSVAFAGRVYLSSDMTRDYYHEGVFIEDNGSFSIVADSTMVDPATGASFEWFDDVQYVGDDLVFSAYAGEDMPFGYDKTYYRWDGTSIEKVAGSDVLPHPLSSYPWGWRLTSADARHFVLHSDILGADSEIDTIYSDLAGDLAVVIDSEMLLDGREVWDFGAPSLWGDGIVFDAHFGSFHVQGAKEIFLATPVAPEPTAAALVVGWLMIVFGRRPRRAC